MSDQNNGLQPIGGLVPIGGLAPIGGQSGNGANSGSSGNSAGSVGGGAPLTPPGTGAMGRVGGAGALPTPPPGAPPTLRPPTPAPSTPGASNPLNLSGAPSVYVPPRAADAEVWQDTDAGSARKIWAGVGAAVVAGLAIGAFTLFRAPARATVPTAYIPYTSGDQLWGFDVPQGWSETASGAATGDDHAVGFNAVTCSSGSAEVNISISTVSGLVKNQLLFGNDITPDAMTGGSHANSVQKSTLKPFKKTLRDYQETDVATNLPWQMGGEVIKGFSANGVTMPDIKTEPDVKMAEFKASSNKWGLGGPVHGYRATLGGSTLIAYAVCQCSERDWPAVKPAFERVLASVHETERAKKSVSSQPGLGGMGGGNLMSPIGGM